MNADVKNTLARVANWPEEDQEELAQIALEIEARRHGVYHATPEELAGASPSGSANFPKAPRKWQSGRATARAAPALPLCRPLHRLQR